MKWSYENGMVYDDKGFFIGRVSTVREQDNGYLVAAAPELLEALKSQRDFLKNHGYDHRLADQAIAKAEGK